MHPTTARITNESGYGSGFIVKIDDENIILGTNQHVVKQQSMVGVYLFDGSFAAGKVLGTNYGYDMAIVSIKVEDIKKANDMGVICGVTTNPSLIAKEGRVFEEVIAEIASIVDGPISGEVKATTVDAEGMIAEGREIAKIHPNMVVKIPMTVEGLKACKALTAEGIKTNVTLIFTANQALLAAEAGATYVSPFLGRLDDISQPGIDLIASIVEIFEIHGIETEIIAASVRNTIHVTDCALAGADIATVPYAILEKMTKHPLTDQGIDKFVADYKAVFGE